jgi:hypothetical protein
MFSLFKKRHSTSPQPEKIYIASWKFGISLGLSMGVASMITLGSMIFTSYLYDKYKEHQAAAQIEQASISTSPTPLPTPTPSSSPSPHTLSVEYKPELSVSFVVNASTLASANTAIQVKVKKFSDEVLKKFPYLDIKASSIAISQSYKGGYIASMYLHIPLAPNLMSDQYLGEIEKIAKANQAESVRIY